MDWATLGSTAASYLLPVLEIAAIIVARLGYQWVKARFKLDISERQEEQIRLGIRNGARGLEEMAAKQLKADPESAGIDKAKLLWGMIEKKWPDLTGDSFDAMLNEELAYMDGMGASGGAQGVMPEDGPAALAPAPAP